MMYEKIKYKWWNSESEFYDKLKMIPYREKRKNEDKFNKVIKRLDYYMNYDSKKEERAKWINKLKVEVKKVLKEDNIFGMKDLEENMIDDFVNVSEIFIDEAKKFDEDIDILNIGQAMRNMWIINIIQNIFNNRVEFTKAAFSYSMLYPYTDNYLDNINISYEQKISFNRKVSLAIQGEKVNSIDDLEKKIYLLINNIEEVFDRKRYPKVFEALKEIQKRQIDSLKQQRGLKIPYESDILGLSIKKGGSSVLADGYLVSGDLNENQIEFCLEYGALLQLTDDLQDVEEDLKNNHTTIMSQLAGKYDLDKIINKLMNFTVKFTEENVCFKNKDNIRRLVKDNCIMLILFSVVLNKKYFSEEFIQNVEKYMPFTIRYIEKLNKDIKNKFKEKEIKLW